jgi:hypothetical protein
MEQQVDFENIISTLTSGLITCKRLMWMKLLKEPN